MLGRQWLWALFPPYSALQKVFKSRTFWGFELGNILDSKCLPQPPEAEALSVWPWGFSHKFRKAETDPERTRTAWISREWLQTEPLPVRRSGWNMPLAKQNTAQKLWNYFEWLSKRIDAKVFCCNLQAPDHNQQSKSANLCIFQVRNSTSDINFKILQVHLTSLQQTWLSGKSFTCQGDNHLSFGPAFWRMIVVLECLVRSQWL